MNCHYLNRRIYCTTARSFLALAFVLTILALPAFGQQITINSGAYFTNIGNAYIKSDNGNLINNGTYNKGSETVTFSGTASKTISGNSATEMYNLTVTNTGGITTQLDLLSTNDLTISTGSFFTIDPAKAVTVNNTLTNNAGNSGLVLKSDASGTASLIHNSNNVPATVQRYISGTTEAWHFLSSPVAAQSINGSWLPSGTFSNGTGYDLYAWNESTNCWIYKLDITSPVNWNTIHPETNFIPERGYLYSVQAANPTKEFAGNLNNGSQSFGLTFSSSDVNLKGFNLVGNPYPSPVDWQAASGWIRTNLANSGGGYDLWIWNPTANNYGIFNSATGFGTNSVTRYIAPMQGYFVRAATAGNLTLDNTVRVHDGASVWKNATINPEKFSLIVKSEADSSSDESLLLFGYPSVQTGAVKLFSPIPTAPSIYLNSGDKNYSVRYLTDTIDYPAVPVMFKAGRDGNYTLSCNFDDSQFKIVLLEDRKTQKIQNMKATATSHFSALKTDDVNRFVLHFNLVKDDSKKEFLGKIYADNSRLIIDLTLVSVDTEVFVYDLMGRKLLHQKLQGKIQHDLSLNANTQILIFSLKNPNGNISRKLLWINN